MHQQMCTTRKPFQRLGGLLRTTRTTIKRSNKLSNEKVHCRKVSATFSRSLKCGNFQGKCKNAMFLRTVFANEKTHLGPTLNTCKVGAWRAMLKNFHSLLFSAQRLVHVCWCTSDGQVPSKNPLPQVVCRNLLEICVCKLCPFGRGFSWVFFSHKKNQSKTSDSKTLEKINWLKN